MKKRWRRSGKDRYETTLKPGEDRTAVIEEFCNDFDGEVVYHGEKVIEIQCYDEFGHGFGRTLDFKMSPGPEHGL